MHMIWAAAAAVVAGAETPPPAPALTTGPAGWEAVAGGTAVASGEVAEGGVIAVQRIAYRRTGVLTKELRGGPIYSRWTVPAGTAAYAVPTPAGVAWCVPGTLTPRPGKPPKRSREQCFYWKEGGLVSSPAFDTKSRFASAVLSGTNIVDGELAVQEQPVPGLPQFRLVAKLGKAKADRQGIEFWFDDGTDATDLVRTSIPKRPDGTIELPLWGGLIRLEPLGGGRYRVNAVEPLKDQLSAAAVLSGGRGFDHASNVQFVPY